jgi:hypothetical protein
VSLLASVGHANHISESHDDFAGYFGSFNKQIKGKFLPEMFVSFGRFYDALDGYG